MPQRDADPPPEPAIPPVPTRAATSPGASPDDPYRLMFERNPLPMCVFDQETLQFLVVNEAMTRRYGYSAAEFGAMTLKDIRPAEDVPALMADLDREPASLDPSLPWRHRLKDGSLVFVEITAQAMQFEGRAARLVLINEVTDRVRIQQALRFSEERFRLVARATTDAVWDWDIASDEVWWSDGMQTLFGYTQQEIDDGSEAWKRRIHPGDAQRVMERMETLLAGSESHWTGEYRYARSDGSYAWVQDRAYVIRDTGGKATRMVGGMSDLTARRAAEHRLRNQAAMLDKATDAILLADGHARITYWNQGAERLYGWTADEALGRVAAELFGQQPGFADELRAQLLAHGDWTGTVNEHHKDGRQITVEGRWTLVRQTPDSPSTVFAIKTDITQRLALEAQLRQAQRLESIGRLTGGVAHDFNNLLTVILGNADLMAEELVDDPALLPLAQMTREAAQRGADLTHRLLAFARRQPLQPQAVDVNELLAGMDGLLRRALNEAIEIELLRAADLPPALIDAAQFESALLNLALNARDAMPRGGKLTLETANAVIDAAYAGQHDELQPGRYVLVSISDNGSGIARENLTRVFEPFFTTKGPGKGSGLGLSMVYGFAKQSRGHLKLYSEAGHGTTARLYLPAADGPADPPVPVEDEQLHRGDATILLVEDDDMVRRFAHDQLCALGYRVLTAENGVRALQLLRENEDVAVLFTDVVIPGGLSGRQLADAALRMRPGLKVLYTSGYTENAIVHHGRLDAGVQLLNKPYRRSELARKVFNVLASATPSDGRP